MDGVGLFAASVAAALAYQKVCGERDDNSITVSAPGKALIAGGYLVLDRGNIGYTIAVSSRFYTTTKSLSTLPKSIVGNNDINQFAYIVVESPQFRSTLTLRYDLNKKAIKVLDGKPNEFIEKCVWLCLIFVQEYYNRQSLEFTSGTDFCESVSKRKVLNGKTIGIKLRANNDFYSQIDALNEKKLDRTSHNLLTHIPAFAPCPLVDESNPAAGVKVAKTGLGSSAALSSSLVGSLLQYFGVIHLESESASRKDRAYIHNIAQFAHSLAQGKIGSGFDVAAAVYGSQIYNRFDPQLLEAVLKHYQPNINPTNNSTASARIFNNKFYDLVLGQLKPDEPTDAASSPVGLPWSKENTVTDSSKSCWNQTIRPIVTPPGVELMMGDVHGGSNTPAMAKKVMVWQKECKDVAEPLVKELGASNERICDLMSRLTELSRSDYKLYSAALLFCSTVSQEAWASSNTASNPIITLFVELKQVCGTSRRLLRRMGELAGVEIEPPCQTALVDATEDVTGVLCAGVPGAGGVDAIYALVLSTESRKAVENVWGHWKDDSESDSKLEFVCPLTLTVAANAGVSLEKLPW